MNTLNNLIGSCLLASEVIPQEVDGKLCIAAYARIYVGIYILVYMCYTFITRECTEDFTDST